MLLINTRLEVFRILGKNISVEMAEDIASDTVLDILENGMPDDLKKIITKHHINNVSMYYKPRHHSLGDVAYEVNAIVEVD